jgi:hypothetical protein
MALPHNPKSHPLPAQEPVNGLKPFEEFMQSRVE